TLYMFLRFRPISRPPIRNSEISSVSKNRCKQPDCCTVTCMMTRYSLSPLRTSWSVFRRTQASASWKDLQPIQCVPSRLDERTHHIESPLIIGLFHKALSNPPCLRGEEGVRCFPRYGLACVAPPGATRHPPRRREGKPLPHPIASPGLAVLEVGDDGLP